MLRLMLADDEQYERNYLEKIIKESYPTLLSIMCKATDGVEFIAKMEECNPQIILLDIKMPRMDGLETARLIREKFPDVQIIVISAYSDFSYTKQAMQLGIAEYLLKPYTDSDFRSIMDRVIARIREREDTLSMLTYSDSNDISKASLIFKNMDKILLWNLFYRRNSISKMSSALELRNHKNSWLKVVLISSSALSSMGDFSQEVLKNFFYMEEATVLNSIWINQMAICLFTEKKECFTDLNSCIRRARNYLAKEHQIPVTCGVSGAYLGLDSIADAYDEAARFITDFSEIEIRGEFLSTSENMKKLCVLEDELIYSYSNNDKETSLYKLNQIIDILEADLGYQDIAIKLNFGRSLMSIIHGVNQFPNIRIKTAEALALLNKLEQLNFNGDYLRNHLEYFSEIKVHKSIEPKERIYEKK